MKIDHICLVVSDLNRSQQFYIDFFGAKEMRRGKASGSWFSNISSIQNPDFEFCILQFPDSETRLELLQCSFPQPKQDEDISTLFAMGFRHVAFAVEDGEYIWKRLSKAGFEPWSNLTQNPWGKKMFYFEGPDGEIIEVAEYNVPTPEGEDDHPRLQVEDNIPFASIYSDGGSRGNPGRAGVGYIILDKTGKELYAGKKYIGIATNNVAEHLGIQLGLQKAKEMGLQNVECFLDSELVVKQFRGEYRVKHPDLKPLYEETKKILPAFSSVSFHHVRRELNKRADELANQAMDEGGKGS